jgi:hypothetical protein
VEANRKEGSENQHRIKNEESTCEGQLSLRSSPISREAIRVGKTNLFAVASSRELGQTVVTSESPQGRGSAAVPAVSEMPNGETMVN